MSDDPDEQRRARELEHRLRAITELARIAAERAVMHQGLAMKHAGFWLQDWESQKSQRLHELARIIAELNCMN